MYKSIKGILSLFLLFILTNNCGGGQSSSNTAKVTLDILAKKLETGPILIGENHLQPFAREAIKRLIQKGKVKKLFLELANFEDATLTGDPDDIKITPYLSTVNRVKDQEQEKFLLQLIETQEYLSRGDINKSRMKDLIAAALAVQDIAIYFDDVPDKPMGEQMEKKKEKEQSVEERNIYSAKLIQSNNLGKYTVILAGQGHLDPNVAGKNTLQALLNINNDRVFNLTTQEVDE